MDPSVLPSGLSQNVQFSVVPHSSGFQYVSSSHADPICSVQGLSRSEAPLPMRVHGSLFWGLTDSRQPRAVRGMAFVIALSRISMSGCIWKTQLNLCKYILLK